MKVLAALSGGVDSAVAAARAVDAGHDVTAVHLALSRTPASHRDGPDFLNVLKYLDLPQVVAMAAERCLVRLRERDAAAWEYPVVIMERLGRPPGQLAVTVVPGNATR